MKKLVPLCLLLLAVITSCITASKAQKKIQANPATNNPAFNWFDYNGQDRVFSQHKAGKNEYQNPILAGFHPDPSNRAGR